MRWTLATIACGVMSSLAFDPVTLPGAMILGIAGFLLILLRLPLARNRVVAGLGLGYGFGFMVPLLWWMNIVSHSAYVGLVVSQMVFYALLAVCLRSVMRLRQWPLCAAGVWVGVEFLRSSIPFSGFPWGRLAHTGDDTPFESYARLLGFTGMSAVMFLAAAAIACAFHGRRPHAYAFAGVGLAGILGLGAILPTGIAGGQGTRTVAMVQGDVPVLFEPWPTGEIFDLHVRETEKLIARIDARTQPQPDFVLWPENATDLDPSEFPSIGGMLDRLVRGLHAPILVGAIFNGPDPDTAYNGGVVWDNDGPGDRYIKRKPVPFGEYIPFRTGLGGIMPRFDRHIPRDLLPGKKSGALDIAGVRIGDSICWDIAYDGVIREDINDGAQVIVVQTSNAAFTGSSQPEQQWKISRLRAVETGRYVLVPSTNGISGIVDPKGHTVARAPAGEPAILSATIRLADGITPGVRFGGRLEAVLVIVGLVGLILGARRGRDSHESDTGHHSDL